MDAYPESYARFWQAADALAAQGKRATLRAVLEAAGEGSMRDVTRAMEIWRQRAQPLTEVSAAVPEALMESVQKLWEAAFARAMARVAEERKALAAAMVSAETKVEELQEMGEWLEGERDAVVAKLATVTAERDVALERVKVVEAEVSSLKALCEGELERLVSRAKANGRERRANT